MSKIDRNIGKLLFLLPIYFTQGGIISSRGSTFYKWEVLFWVFIALYYTVRYNMKYKKSMVLYEKLSSFFVVVMCVYWLLSPKTISNADITLDTYGELKNVMIMMLSYFPFRYAIKSRWLTEEYLKKYAVVLMVAYLIAFFNKQYEALQAEFWKDAITNNGGYYVVFIMPIIGLIVEKKYSYVLMLVSIVLILLSAKRGAIVCMAAVFLLFLKYGIKTENRKFGFRRVLVIIVMLAVVLYIFKNSLNNNAYLLSRLQGMLDGDSSGRDEIYGEALNVYYQGPFLRQIFGYGFFQTLPTVGMYAHNDWLELLVDSGIIGIILYLMVFGSLLVWYHKRCQYILPRYKYMFLSSLSIWVGISLFSMGYYAPEASALGVAIAISISNTEDSYSNSPRRRAASALHATALKSSTCSQ